MQRLSERYDPSTVAASAQALWTERSMPAPPGTAGPREGPTLRQFLGAISETEPPLAFIARSVIADVRARYDALCGQRTIGVTVVRDPTAEAAIEARRAMIERVGAWTSSGTPEWIYNEEGAARLQEMVDVLAVAGLIVRRDLPLRTCPMCRATRSPEEIVYQEEKGPAYLVRFVLPDRSPTTSLVVWTDALWKLLGTSAILIDPKQTYVLARYQRRGTDERIIVARSAIPRLKEWLSLGEIEVIEERPGAELVGLGYIHPLAAEHLAAPDMPPPAGTVLANWELGNMGTGLVALAPRHGGSDAAAARALHVMGWNVLAADGRVSWERGHKYAGLPIDVAESFLLRDLNDAGLIFAELLVPHGVPYCAVCDTALVWSPGRAWCYDLARLPDAALDDFARLLPGEPRPAFDDRVPWPMSSTVPSTSTTDPQLRECDRCERLSPGLSAGPCACGGTVSPVRRRILPATAEAFRLWEEAPRGEAVHLFVPDRRRTPAVLEHLVAREAARLRFGDLGLARLPTFPLIESAALERLLGSPDALRSALVWASASSRRPARLLDRWRQEERRLHKFWELARRVLDGMLRAGLTNLPEPIAGRTEELSEEDRAFLARFERTRIEVRALYDDRRLSVAQERLLRFMEEDLREGYIPLIQPRLDPSAAPTVQLAAYRLLGQVITQWAELYAPVAPFAMEEIVRAFRFDQASLFERGFTPINDSFLDPDREAEFGRWVGFAAALGDARRQVGLPSTAILPKVVLIVPDDASAQAMGLSRTILARLGRVGEIEIDSPNQPWSGRRVDCRPVASEIQRVHGSMAPRIVRILEHMPARKVLEGVRAGTLSVTIEGGMVSILPSMVQFAESLPECVVPVPWRGIEILVVDPRGTAESSLPALSLDGFRIVRHVRRRLRRTPPGTTVDRVVVAASGDLGVELAHHGSAIGQHLGVAHWEVVSDPLRLDESERSNGRTRRGEPWWVWIPGLRAPVRHAKRRPIGGLARRVRLPPPPEATGPDMFDEAHASRASAIAELVESLAKELGRPIIGPAKAAEAWDSGLRSVEDYAHAPYERLAPIPGFGPAVAAEVVRHFGGPVPVRARPARARTIRERPATTAVAPEVSQPPPAAGVPSPPPPPAPAAPPAALPGSAPEPAIGSFPEAAGGGTSGAIAPAPTVVAGQTEGPPSSVSTLGPNIPAERAEAIGPSVPAPELRPPSVVPTAPARPPTPVPIAPRPTMPPRLEYLSVPPPPAPAPAPPSGQPLSRETSPTPTPAPPAPSATPAVAPPLPTPPPAAEAPQGLLLWPGPDEHPAWTEFLHAITSGRRAMCVTRLSPELRSRSFDRPDIELVWLSNTKNASVPTIRPGNLVDLVARVRTAIIDRKVESVFIDGVEYLALIHGIGELLSAMTVLDEVARAHHSAILVPLNAALMDEAEFSRLSGMFEHGAPTAAT
jgi:hypothetical protein